MRDHSLSRFCLLAGVALISLRSHGHLLFVATVGFGDSMSERFILWFTASLPWSLLLLLGIGAGTVLTSQLPFGCFLRRVPSHVTRTVRDQAAISTRVPPSSRSAHRRVQWAWWIG